MSYVVYTVPLLWATYYYCLSKLSNSGLSYSTLQSFQALTYVFVVLYGLGSGNTDTELRSLKSNTVSALTLLTALLSSTAASVVVYYSFRTVSPLVVATLETLYPVVLYVLLLLTRERNLSTTSVLGLVLTVFGVVLVLRDSKCGTKSC